MAVSKSIKLLLGLGLMVGFVLDRASAQSGCTSVIISMAPCLGYVTGNASTPSSSCCSQLSSVLQSRPECLCSMLNGGAASLGITVNQTRALAIPAACNVQTPPVSACDAVNGGAPSAAPASSPSAETESPSPANPSSAATTTPSISSAEGGSKTTPATGATAATSAGGSSDGFINNLLISSSAAVGFMFLFATF
ncbi:non-specific lipid transfer protein GPI-anchored 5-like [Zingiber officinale]|uniref:non-specific lipid transfer protein GPI-anchored 5-like n=1 Tax=Zingiber officinale TaxID=94328 RepID=UPI001C4BDBF9|nr:non-specific lipid transfer protein GPI-anchored 5-like [Zingiber officinale]